MEIRKETKFTGVIWLLTAVLVVVIVGFAIVIFRQGGLDSGIVANGDKLDYVSGQLAALSYQGTVMEQRFDAASLVGGDVSNKVEQVLKEKLTYREKLNRPLYGMVLYYKTSFLSDKTSKRSFQDLILLFDFSHGQAHKYTAQTESAPNKLEYLTSQLAPAHKECCISLTKMMELHHFANSSIDNDGHHIDASILAAHSYLITNKDGVNDWRTQLEATKSEALGITGIKNNQFLLSDSEQCFIWDSLLVRLSTADWKNSLK